MVASERAALRFYRATLFATLRRLAADRRFRTVLAVTPDGARGWPPRIPRVAQGRGDLGARMWRACRRQRRGKVAIVGSDIPDLRSDDVARAFRLLGRAPACFGPAMDGGYWLVGFGPRRPERPFAGVRWSTGHALADTLANCGGANCGGRRVVLLRRLRDVDTEADLRALVASWFDLGFLELRRIDWSSPAALLEKLVGYEAVHRIRTWRDLKNRLDSDRRCYAFFHPRMPEEPLIFVEVALVRGLAGSVQDLLDERAPVLDPRRADTAIFYSINNCQRGLDGIAFPSGVRTMPVEATENVAPVVFWRKELRPGSGGAGRTRGGMGQIMEIGAKSEAEFACNAIFDRVGHPPRGRDGGEDGAPGRVYLKSGATLRTKGYQLIPAGDRLVLELPGGVSAERLGRRDGRAGASA